MSLVAQWIRTQASGSSTLTDDVGGYDMTMSNFGGSEWDAASRRVGNAALDFNDTSSQYTEVGGVPGTNYDNDFSATVWFKTTNPKNATETWIIGRGPWITGHWGIKYGGSALYLQLEGGGTYPFGSGLDDGKWHNVVFVWNGGGRKRAWLDGVSMVDTTGGGSFSGFTNSQNILLGVRADQKGSTNFYFDGLIQDARYYDHALSDPEVAAIWTEGPIARTLKATGGDFSTPTEALSGAAIFSNSPVDFNIAVETSGVFGSETDELVLPSAQWQSQVNFYPDSSGTATLNGRWYDGLGNEAVVTMTRLKLGIQCANSNEYLFKWSSGSSHFVVDNCFVAIKAQNTDVKLCAGEIGNSFRNSDIIISHDGGEIASFNLGENTEMDNCFVATHSSSLVTFTPYRNVNSNNAFWNYGTGGMSVVTSGGGGGTFVNSVSSAPNLNEAALATPNDSPATILAKDLSFTASSPLADAANGSDSAVTDIISVARPQGGGYDIGCYETTNTNSPPTINIGIVAQTSTNIVGVAYQGIDAEENTCSLQASGAIPGYEFSTGPAYDTWETMTVTGDVSGVVYPASGVNLTLNWDVGRDIGTYRDGTARVRLTAFDGTEYGTSQTSTAFAYDTNPVVPDPGLKSAIGYRVPKEEILPPVSTFTSAFKNRKKTID